MFFFISRLCCLIKLKIFNWSTILNFLLSSLVCLFVFLCVCLFHWISCCLLAKSIRISGLINVLIHPALGVLVGFWGNNKSKMCNEGQEGPNASRLKQHADTLSCFRLDRRKLSHVLFCFSQRAMLRFSELELKEKEGDRGGGGEGDEEEEVEKELAEGQQGEKEEKEEEEGEKKKDEAGWERCQQSEGRRGGGGGRTPTAAAAEAPRGKRISGEFCRMTHTHAHAHIHTHTDAHAHITDTQRHKNTRLFFQLISLA